MRHIQFWQIFLPLALAQGDVDYSCDLRWVAEGYGNVPSFAISPSPGEFVARVHLQNENVWRAGRLLPVDGKAFVRNASFVNHKTNLK